MVRHCWYEMRSIDFAFPVEFVLAIRMLVMIEFGWRIACNASPHLSLCTHGRA